MSPRGSKPNGFTLVELTIVIAILAILAAMVIPRYQDYRAEAAIAAIQANVRAIKTQVDRDASENNAWPADLDPAWFVGGEVPSHAHNTFGVDSHQLYVVNDASHPGSKVLKTGVAGAYWYNANTGDVRARVADQGTEADTLTAYNEINGSSETALGNYGGGGGGGS